MRNVALENTSNLQLQQSGSADKVTNIHSISNIEELKSRIRADLNADIPLEGVSISTENSYLSSLVVSNTSLTQVIQETWTGTPATLDVDKLRLTEEAREILNGPNGWKRFSEKYGEYFVYGYIPRARFSAIAHIKTSSEAIRDRIKTSLEGGIIKKVGSVGATLESVNSSKNDFVGIDIFTEVVGLKSQGDDDRDPSTSTATNNIEEVQNSYKDFSHNHEVKPYIGLLCHYSGLTDEGGFPPPRDQFAHLGPELNKMYKGLVTAQITLSISPMVGASATCDKITGLCETIKSLNITDTQAIRRMSDDFNVCMEEVDAWRLRSDLVEDVRKLQNNDLKHG